MKARCVVVCMVTALVAACSSGGDAEGQLQPGVPVDAEVQAKASLPHSPLAMEEISGKMFELQAEGVSGERIHFIDDRAFVRIRTGSEETRGEYVLTPDGRLCMVPDGSADSSCWRRLPNGPSGGAIALQHNPGPRDVLLLPLDTDAGEGQ